MVVYFSFGQRRYIATVAGIELAAGISATVVLDGRCCLQGSGLAFRAKVTDFKDVHLIFLYVIGELESSGSRVRFGYSRLCFLSYCLREGF